MIKRAISGFVWLLAVWSGYHFLMMLANLPEIGGPLLGLTVAAYVMFDPQGVFWATSSEPVDHARSAATKHTEPSPEMRRAA